MATSVTNSQAKLAISSAAQIPSVSHKSTLQLSYWVCIMYFLVLHITGTAEVSHIGYRPQTCVLLFCAERCGPVKVICITASRYGEIGLRGL